MKKTFVIGFLVLLLAAVVWADPRLNNKKIQGHQTLNVSSDSTADSMYVSGSANLVNNNIEGFTSIMVKIILRGPISAYAGIGNDDSAWIWLRTHWAGETVLLDSAVSEGLPTTLRYAVSSDSLGTDTLLKDYLSVDWAIYDSLGDTTINVKYDISWDINLK